MRATGQADCREAGVPGRSDHGAARKAYLRGTHRTVDPAVTVARVRELMPRLGITRVANVTGLDYIGIPVVMVCRPNSRSVAVSQGKGIDLAAAIASGLMEAAELYHAEHVKLPTLRLAHDELRRSHRAVDVCGLARPRQGAFRSDLPLQWIEGWDLLAEQVCWVPFESVHLDFTLAARRVPPCFISSTNGLASGNHQSEAISAALCEVIERDAMTLFGLAGPAARRERRVDPESVDDPLCRGLVDAFDRSGIAVGIWDITSDIGIAAFHSQIASKPGSQFRPLPGGGGYGCHPARHIALLRSLTEAAQSRLALIAGSRDDLWRDRYERLYDGRAEERGRRWMAYRGPMRRYREAPNFESLSFHEDVAWELYRLHGAGIREAVIVDLTDSSIGLPVVRAVVPGLEFVDRSTHRGVDAQYGPRARRAIEEREARRSILTATTYIFAPAPEDLDPAVPTTTQPAHRLPPTEGIPVSVEPARRDVPGRHRAVVFLGPTLSSSEAMRYLDALYLPPVSQGDMYRAAALAPRVIGIVDGYFERVPAVWHKEILWAMSQGIHVFGAASMGALRAAELARFGMEGVGRVFEAYRDGYLEDDDEVAVLHGPAEVDYRAVTDAMVDLRFALRAAELDGVITSQTGRWLEGFAKSLYYGNRTWRTVLDHARQAGQPNAELDALAAWLDRGHLRPKRDDAVAMLQLIQARLVAGLAPKQIDFPVEVTLGAEVARRQALSDPSSRTMKADPPARQ